MIATMQSRNGSINCKIVSITPVNSAKYINTALKGGVIIMLQNQDASPMYLSIDKEAVDIIKGME